MSQPAPVPTFPIDDMLDRVRSAIARYPKAVMFELADRGFASLYQQVVACIVSVRTREEETLPACLRLFSEASDPATLAALTEAEIDRLIRPSTFHEQKAGRISEIARIAAASGAAGLPCDRDAVMALPGVGPKCANLALGIACTRRGLAAGAVEGAGNGDAAGGALEGRPISVDIHVHRVTNRWGYISAPTPEKTMAALARVLPPRYDVEINALLVPFGKHICTGVAPRCSTCPVLSMCRQVGVSSHR